MTTRRLALLYGVGTAALLGGVIFLQTRPQQLRSDVTIVERATDIAMGSTVAPPILVFASLTCSHCREWETSVLPELDQGAIARGEVRLILREHPRNAEDLRGAAFLAAMPASERRRARSLAVSQGVDRALEAAARGDLGDVGVVAAAQAGDETSQRIIAGHVLDDRATFGVMGTPTFVLGRSVFLGGRAAEELVRLARA